MRNSIYLLVIVAMGLSFSGCSIVYSDVKNAYVTAKVVYQDAKYVLHEIQDEQENLKKEFADWN